MKLSDLHSGKGSTQELRNCLDFISLTETYHRLTFFQPSRLAAPWHWQVRLENDTGEDIIINFWPHKGKCYCAHVGKARGYEPQRALILHAIEKNAERCR